MSVPSSIQGFVERAATVREPVELCALVVGYFGTHDVPTVKRST